MVPSKEVEEMANSVDHDQTAHVWVYQCYLLLPFLSEI